MAKQGKRAIIVPKGIDVSAKDGCVKITGPSGTLSVNLPDSLSVRIDKEQVQVGFAGGAKPENIRGLFRALINRRVFAVRDGITKKLEIVGVGYQGEVKGKNLVLKMGFSHPVTLAIPEGIKTKVEKNLITISGVDPEKVGEFAAQVRAVRIPEPYGGKGIRYSGEYVRHKVGKTAGAGTTTTAK